MKFRSRLWGILLLAFLLTGFDLQNLDIPVGEIQESGVPVDGIPALDEPEWISSEQANDFMEEMDLVVGLVRGPFVRAYPLKILNWHEIVNDTFNDSPVLVTYCPISGTVRVFERKLNGTTVRFGVSGKLYKNNLLLFDRETKSLWSQMLGKAVSGSMKGTFLQDIPVTVTSWRAWKKKHPSSQILSLNTGFLRDYGRDPYEDYALSDKLMFPVEKIRPEFAPKTRVVGIFLKGTAKAYSLDALARQKRGRFDDRIGESSVVIEWVQELGDVKVYDILGSLIPAVRTYWFAWQAFYPETEVYTGA